MDEKNKNYEELDMYEFIRSNGEIKKEIEDYRLHKKNKPSIHRKEVSKLSINQNKIYGPSEITREEYEELCMRYARGEKLTKEELISLKNATINSMEEAGAKQLKPKNYGYVNNYFALYIVTMIIFIVFIIGLLLVK